MSQTAPPILDYGQALPDGGILRALRHRNYRLFFGGQLVSLVGTFLTNTAMSWLALTLTGDPRRQATVLGIVAFSSQVPLFFLAPVAGVWVDRLDRRRLLIVTQTLSMLQSFALAALTLSHLINIPELIFLALCKGVVNAIDMPGRQAFLVEMVTDRRDLSNAIALNSTMVHSARLIGPAAAGLIIYFSSTGLCFLIDGISYIGVIAALFAMVIQPRASRKVHSVVAELREGISYIVGVLPMRVLLIVQTVFSLTGVPAMMVLLPLFGKHFGGEHLGSRVFGFLAAANGAGALAGAIYLASRRSVLGLERLISNSSVLYSVAIGAFALSQHLWLSMLIIPFAGCGMIINFASANTILQTLAEDDKRGRVMSFFSMCFAGMTPLGALMVGRVATLFSNGRLPIDGARRTILCAAAICFMAAMVYRLLLPIMRRHMHPIYVKRGILSRL